MRLGFILSLCFLWFQSVHAQKDSTRNTTLKVLPTAYYTPETKIAVEGFAYLSFYSKKAERASNVRLFLTATQNRQLSLDLPWQIFTAGESFRISGKVSARKFPEYFYGIGNNTQEKLRELYSFNSLGITNRILKQSWGNNYIGAAIEGMLLNTKLPLSNFHMISDTMDIVGAHGYGVAGIGPSFIHDSRDVLLCPRKGRFVEVTALFNVGMADGKSIKYSKLIFDYREYFKLKYQTVFAYQIAAQSTIGSVPYRELPALGGPLMHRGFYFGRFRDKHLVFSQAEIRKHLFWRIGAVAFGSVGRVCNDDDLLAWRGFHPAGGGGIRFKLSAKDEANIRFDFAVTLDSKGFYVYFAEAF